MIGPLQAAILALACEIAPNERHGAYAANTQDMVPCTGSSRQIQSRCANGQWTTEPTTVLLVCQVLAGVFLGLRVMGLMPTAGVLWSVQVVLLFNLTIPTGFDC